jgi:hypothetical protein
MDYKSLAVDVNVLLKEVGFKVKITRNGAAVGSALAVFTSKKTTDLPYPQAQTQSTDRVLLISGLSKPPAVGDFVIADKTTFRIVAIEVVRPSTTTLLYKAEVIE